jgi:SLOG in TRPM, prokaryote
LAELFGVEFANGLSGTAIRVEGEDELTDAVRRLGLVRSAATVVLVGGADGLGDTELARLRPLFADVLVPLVETLEGLVLDGGTDTGVMQLMGQARAQRGAAFPLVGVLVQDLAALQGEASSREAAELEPNHTHFVLVPGKGWGDEARWLARLGSVVAQESRSITVLVDGGEIAWADVAHSVEAGRPVIVVDGSGRTADSLAAGLRGERPDERVAGLVGSGLIRSVALDDREALGRVLEDLLAKEV